MAAAGLLHPDGRHVVPAGGGLQLVTADLVALHDHLSVLRAEHGVAALRQQPGLARLTHTDTHTHTRADTHRDTHTDTHIRCVRWSTHQEGTVIDLT